MGNYKGIAERHDDARDYAEIIIARAIRSLSIRLSDRVADFGFSLFEEARAEGRTRGRVHPPIESERNTLTLVIFRNSFRLSPIVLSVFFFFNFFFPSLLERFSYS